MYLEFYGLSEKPFSQTPDPRFLYWNDAYRETLASLSYGIRERKGFIAMLGEAGTGKTTLLRKLLDELGDDIVSVFLFNPNATFEEILEYTLSELGITAPSGRKLAMLQRLNEFLLAAYGEGRNTILLIDEAQDLDSDVLESLRLLSNLETSDDKILQIVLSGQPELAEKLADPSLRQLKQRISVRCKLEPLQYEELPEYLSARLSIAGGSPDLFDPETLPAIWEFTWGIPRIINTVCDNALLLGYALGKRTIDSSVMQEVILDLRKLDVDNWLPTPVPSATPGADPGAAPGAPSSAAPPRQPTTELPPQPAPQAEPMEHAPQGTQYQDGPPREAMYSAGPAGQRERPNSLGWMVAAVLAGIVLLLAGAWLGQAGRDAPIPTRSTSSDQESRSSAVDLAGPTVATAATREPAAREPIGRGAIAAAPAPRRRDLAPDASFPRAESVVAKEDWDAGAPSANSRTAPEAPPSEPVVTRKPAPVEVPPELDTARRAAATEPEAPELPAVAPVESEPVAEAGGREEPVAAQPRPLAPAADEATLVAKADPVPPPAAAEPIREERLALANPAPAKPVPQPVEARARAARDTVSVAPGDTLLELAGRHYGRTNLTTLDMLRVVNPDIRDVDLIIAGSGLEFPDPGPASRVLAEGKGYTVLAMTTQTLSRALAVQSSLEDQLGRPVSLERVATRGGSSIFRVSIRGLSAKSDASDIANGLGPILQDPTP